MLKLQDVQSGYGKVKIIHDMNLSLDKGKVLCILGSNGSGKTTIMRTICGLVKPTGGTILFEDQDITEMPAHHITELGIIYVPEGRRLFGKLSILDNLYLGSYLKQNRLKRKENLEKVYTMFPKLYERRHQKAGTLSGGEQQMCAIARGLMGCPSILMLDEPSLGIAPVIVDRLFEIIEELKKQGMTILISEQNVVSALNVADEGIVIQSGRIVMSGTSAELSSSDTIQKAYLGM